MSAPIVENIAANFKTTISAITTGNGFNQTLTGKRPSRKDLQTPWNDLDVLINQVEAEEVKQGIGCKRWRQYFLLVILFRDSDDDTDPIDTRRNYARADVEKKLAEDLTRGGNAIDTNFHEASPWDDDEGGLGGLVLKISVDYSTKEDDPYTKR